jgi:hypothetical protein
MNMRPKTTRALLDRLVSQVNELTGNPLLTWNVGEWDETTQSVLVTANLGNYYVTKVGNGYRVEQINTLGGGTHCPLGSDVYTAREIEVQLRAYILGLENK